MSLAETLEKLLRNGSTGAQCVKSVSSFNAHIKGRATFRSLDSALVGRPIALVRLTDIYIHISCV